MDKLQQILKYLMNLVPSIFLMITGAVLFIHPNFSEAVVYFLLIGYLIIKTITALFSLTQKLNFTTIVESTLYLTLQMLCLFKPIVIRRFLNLSVGIFSIIYGLIRFVDYYALRKNGSKGIIFTFFVALISFTFGFVTVCFNIKPFQWFYKITSIYFFIKGFVDFSRQCLNIFLKVSKNPNYARFSVAAPVFISALLPIRVYTDIKRLIRLHKIKLSDIDDQKENSVEIWIHLKAKGFEQFGHVDISYQDIVYSYGAHDPQSREIFGSVGKGVLLVVDRLKFLKYCIDANEMVISFTLDLNDNNRLLLQQRIFELMQQTIPYTCCLKKEMEQGLTLQACDYASRVYKATGAKMFMFKEGKFKTYYVFSTNCVLLADTLLRNNQFNLFQFLGLITPGSFLNYLYQEYESNTSFVKKVDVYCK